MKRALMLAMALVVVTITGCAGLVNGPVPGFLYNKTKGPLMATDNSATTRMGKATCTTILGLVAEGDCSVKAAKANGGISHVTDVDVDYYNVLGLYGTYTTIVRGN